jgi:hypothetical protein
MLPVTVATYIALKMGLVGCPETLARNYHCLLPSRTQFSSASRQNPEIKHVLNSVGVSASHNCHVN